MVIPVKSIFCQLFKAESSKNVYKNQVKEVIVAVITRKAYKMNFPEKVDNKITKHQINYLLLGISSTSVHLG